MWDLIVACDNLSFFSILLLKKLGLVKKTIYYSVDYVTERFENRIINWTYHYVDRLAIYNSDVNWVVAKEQIIAREKNGIDLKKAAPFEVVPIGFRAKEVNITPVSKLDFYNLVFCGTLRESAGPHLVIEALPKVLKKFPKTHAIFIGGGNKSDLVTLAKKLRVQNRVRFYQDVDDHKKLVRVLTKCSIGLAPYIPAPGSISLTSDPGKIKLYLLCGLPVVTTKVATSHKIIARNKAGRVIDHNADSLAKSVIYLLSSKKRYTEYKEAAIRLGHKFDSDRIFKKALSKFLYL
jgi:glycosyltransferase involved in cell wall biosynthesis